MASGIDTAFTGSVAQFGVMFFPDRLQAFAQARRVLRPDGASKRWW